MHGEYGGGSTREDAESMARQAAEELKGDT